MALCSPACSPHHASACAVQLPLPLTQQEVLEETTWQQQQKQRLARPRQQARPERKGSLNSRTCITTAPLLSLMQLVETLLGEAEVLAIVVGVEELCRLGTLPSHFMVSDAAESVASPEHATASLQGDRGADRTRRACPVRLLSF